MLVAGRALWRRSLSVQLQHVSCAHGVSAVDVTAPAAEGHPRSSSQSRLAASSSDTSGAASFPYGRAAEMRSSHPGSNAGTASETAGPSGAASFPYGRAAEPAGESGGADRDQDREASAEETQLCILEAALRHVAEKGWTLAALQAGAADCKLSPAAAALVQGAEAGLVQYFVERCNERLAAELAERRDELAAMRVPDRIRTAVRLRLEMLAPVVDTWPQALAIQAWPGNVPAAARALAGLADDIWHAAGDTSTDYNWYTKRALLSGVIAATELYMLTDFSPGYADTWASLDRRLRDVSDLGKAASQARGWLGSLATGMESLMASMAARAQQAGPQSSGGWGAKP